MQEGPTVAASPLFPASASEAEPPPPPATPSRDARAPEPPPLATGAETGAPHPPAVRIPAPVRLGFDVTGQAKGFQYSARAELLWQHDGQQYQARQEISVLFLGSRSQTSLGEITPPGL